MTPDEIVKALECEATCNAGNCPIEECGSRCPYCSSETYTLDALISAAANALKTMQARANQAGLNYQQKCRDVAELEQQLSESQRREQAAVEDIEKMMRICEKGSCHFCADGDCTESPYCSPKWRGPQEAGKGAAK